MAAAALDEELLFLLASHLAQGLTEPSLDIGRTSPPVQTLHVKIGAAANRTIRGVELEMLTSKMILACSQRLCKLPNLLCLKAPLQERLLLSSPFFDSLISSASS